MDLDDDVQPLPEQRGYQKLAKGVLIDSGAGASVADGDQFPGFKREPSEGSRKGQKFVGPGSERISNRGQKRVDIMTKDGIKSSVMFQDAPVRRPILAVSDSTKAGNMVLFDSDESVIIPRESVEGKAIRDLIKKARRKVKLECDQGVYQLPSWVVTPGNGDDRFTGQA